MSDEQNKFYDIGLKRDTSSSNVILSTISIRSFIKYPPI